MSGVDTSIVRERIRIARLSLGLTPREFAAKADVGLRSLYQWETGAREPSVQSVRRIAAATGRPIGWFFGLEEEQVA